MPEIYLRQELKLTQKLVMTQQLQLAIKLLQMSRMEIDQEIQQQLVENPCLEEDASALPDPQQPQASEAPDSRKPSLEELERIPATAKAAEAEGDGAATQSREDFNWDRFVENYESFRDGGPAVRASVDDAPSFENFVAAKITLQDHLLWQLRMSDMEDLEIEVAEEIIGNIDDYGYLRGDDGEDPLVWIASRLSVPEDFAAGVLGKIQGFDPIGVAARDLRECLRVQALHSYPEEEHLLRLIDEHLEDLERKRGRKIAKALGLTPDRVVELADMLSNLEPRPGRSFGGVHNPYVVPDVHVHKVEGEYVVVLNDDGLSRLKISGYYRKGLRGQDRSTRDFIKKRLDAAMWFIKSIEQRQQTIRKVAESIVNFQREFLDQGSEYLRPLVLRDVANDIGMHESTVSRVTSNKYMHTQQGIFPMKYFFNSRIERDGSPDLASEAVKRKISRLIHAEDSQRPYSDQAIADALGEAEGIRIARRTVAKYREQLNIPPSSERKRLI